MSERHDRNKIVFHLSNLFDMLDVTKSDVSSLRREPLEWVVLTMSGLTGGTVMVCQTVTIHELLAGMYTICEGTAKDKLALAFHCFDANADGRISKEEMCRQVAHSFWGHCLYVFA